VFVQAYEKPLQGGIRVEGRRAMVAVEAPMPSNARGTLDLAAALEGGAGAKCLKEMNAVSADQIKYHVAHRDGRREP
jgi:hypothetical protein